MEAYAALKLRKKQEAQAKALALEQQYKEVVSKAPSTYEEQRKIQRVLGFADPPNKVFALGKDGKAAVWWFYDNQEGILGWEVVRYRKDRSKPELNEWQNKGSTKFEAIPRLQVIIDGLTNDHEYRFTVQALNHKGPSLESLPSNEIIVESPLPSGWYRFYDKRKKKHYYASLKTGRSTWTRPELDPYFLEDEIYKNFTMEELQHLKGLFVEDMEHFRRITLEQFMDILQEIGESCSKRWILQLFQAYSKSDNQDLKTWQEFMNIINHIKTARMKPTIVKNPFEFVNLFYNRAKIRTVLSPNRDKLGLWVKEFNTFAGKEYYRHLVTGECSWTVPDEVKFYLSPKFEQRLLKVFDYGQLEEFKQHFALLDIDNSGDLSDKEIKILLNSMGISIGELKLAELIKAIDVNGNGSIEFDEFCYLMFEICRKDKTGVFKDLKASKNLSLLDGNKKSDGLASLAISNDFNFQKLSVAAKGLRDSQHQYALDSGNSDETSGKGSICCCFSASVASQIVPTADVSRVPNSEDQNNSPSKLHRQVSFDAKVSESLKQSNKQESLSVSSKGSAKKKSHKKNNEFSDDESDLSDSEDDEEEERSTFIQAFSRGSSKKNKDGHGPYCMCGCRRDIT